MYTCRECEKPVNQATEICPYCGADLTVVPPSEADSSTVHSGATRRQVLLVRWVTWGSLVAAMWAFLWLVLPERRVGDAISEAEGRAIVALRETRAELAAYAESQGGYPVTLEGLGEQAQQKIRGTAQRAQSQGYRLEYAAAPPDVDGTVRNFTLLARPGHYSYRNFFTDSSGVIRSTRENRPATADDQPI